MSYGVRWVLPDGKTGHWTAPFATREDAESHAALRQMANGLSYTVEEVPDVSTAAVPDASPDPTASQWPWQPTPEKPTSTTERLVGLHRDLAFALQLGDAMREAMRTGEWRAGHDRSMANSAIAGWDRFKPGLAKAPSVPVGASEAPMEGGDSDRRRLEALRAFLEGNEDASLSWYPCAFWALGEGVAIEAPTLATIADKLAEKGGKP